MRDTNPGWNQKTGVVSEQVAILFPEFWGPADKMVPWPKMPCCRAKSKACQQPVSGKSHVLEVLSNRLRVSQVMVLLDEAVEQLFRRTSSNLMNRDGEKLPQRLFDGAPVDLHSFRRSSLKEGIFERNFLPWRQTDSALSFESQ